jgi:hypothetical protein
MRTTTKQVFTFDELSDDAKEKARDWYREGAEFPWCEEYKASINAFIDHFGATLKDWNIGPWSPLEYRVEFGNSNFRGAKLSQFTGEEMPTGFCADCDLWGTFREEFKRTGNAMHAFDEAIDAGFKAWRDDWEYSLSDDAVDDAIRANEYEFYENGEIK